MEVFAWGRQTRKKLREHDIADAEVDIRKVYKFLSLRRGRYQQPVSELLDLPERRGNGWFRCRWIRFHEEQLPKENGLEVALNLN